MLHAMAAWEHGRYRPYELDETLMLEDEVSEHVALPLTLRRALACRRPLDLEWTVLLVPALTALLDEGTGGFGGTWPVKAVTTALATRAVTLEENADDWATGASVEGGSLMSILISTRLPQTPMTLDPGQGL